MTFDEMSAAAVHVMDNVKVPKFVFHGCAAIILIKANEAGFIFSQTDGGGLIFRKTETGWSQPAAFKLKSIGVGITAGFAERDTVMCLNRFAAEKFMVNDFKLDFNVDLGAAVGTYGASAEASVGISDKGGVAASMVYAHQKGVIVNCEVNLGGLENAREPNRQMYGTDLVKNILDGTAKPNDPAKVEELIKKVNEFTKSE